MKITLLEVAIILLILLIVGFVLFSSIEDNTRKSHPKSSRVDQ